MKILAKMLVVGGLLTASAPLALAVPITGSIGIQGYGTATNVGGVITYTPTPSGTAPNPFPLGSPFNAFVNVGGPVGSSLATFTFMNGVTMSAFSTAGTPALVFTTAEGGRTLTFTLVDGITVGSDPAGPGFSGTGILSETGFDNTFSTFTLNTNTGAGTSITFNAVAPTPEPSSLMLMGTGLVSAAGMLVRRRRQTVA